MRPPGSPRQGVPGRLHREAAGERPPRARPQRRGSPGPIPNPAVKPAFAESTAARGCGAGQGVALAEGAFSIGAARRPGGGMLPAAAGLFLRYGKVAASLAARSALRCIRPPPGIVGRAGTAGGSSLRASPASWGIVRWGGLIGAARHASLLFIFMKAPARFAGAWAGPQDRPCGSFCVRGRSLPEDLREDFLLDRSCARHVPEDLRGLPAGLLALTWTSNLTEAVRPALSRRSAVSKRFCIGRPPLWCRRYVPRVSEVRGVYAPSILLCLCCYWLVWSVLRLSLSVLHFLVNVFDS